MWCFWNLEKNVNSLAIPPVGRIRLHMMQGMVEWSIQEAEEGQKELGLQTLQSGLGLGLQNNMRERIIETSRSGGR